MSKRFPIPFFCLSALLSVFACNSSASTEEESRETRQETGSAEERPLAKVLQEKKANFEKKEDSTKKADYAAGIQDIIKKQIVDNALQVGDKAPNFKLKNATGREISLYASLENGPIILIWYRGGWCPYCNLTLHYMQEYLPQFKQAGAQLMALTPELPDKSLDTKEKNALSFEVLSDTGNRVAKQYGLVFKLTDPVAKAYQKSFDLQAYNGNTSNELPLAATYIIGADRIIKYAFLNADYRLRAEPSDILSALKGFK